MVPVELLQQLTDGWPSKLVSRNMLESFTGGLVTAETIRQSDDEPTKLKLKGRKVGYFVEDVLHWLSNNLELVEKEKTVDQLVQEILVKRGQSNETLKSRLKKLQGPEGIHS